MTDQELALQQKRIEKAKSLRRQIEDLEGLIERVSKAQGFAVYCGLGNWSQQEAFVVERRITDQPMLAGVSQECLTEVGKLIRSSIKSDLASQLAKAKQEYEAL